MESWERLSALQHLPLVLAVSSLLLLAAAFERVAAESWQHLLAPHHFPLALVAGSLARLQVELVARLLVEVVALLQVRQASR